MIGAFALGAFIGMLFGALWVGVLMIEKLEGLEAENRKLKGRLEWWRNLARSV